MAKVERLSVEPVTPPTPSNPLASILGMMQAIAIILSVRLFLLLSVIGAFILAYNAMQMQFDRGLWSLGIFCTLTILPLVFLDIKTRTR